MNEHDCNGLTNDSPDATARHREHDPGLPGVATPDQTRHDGMRPDLAKSMARAETSGIVELRKRKGNLEGM